MDTQYEKFDIEAYEKSKSAGSADVTLPDGTYIQRFSAMADGGIYVEKIVPPTGWFETYKVFYKNGGLKEKGMLFKNSSSQFGTWVTYDSNGMNKKETNADSDFKLSLDEVFEILKKNNISLSIEDNRAAIRRVVKGNSIPKTIWFASWSEGDGESSVRIDDETGAVSEKDHMFVAPCGMYGREI